MSIIKWDPNYSPLEDFFNDEDFFMPMRRRMGRRFVPALDMYEDKDNVIVETEISGIDPEKVSITFEDDVLKIEGSSERKSEVDDKEYYRKEIRAGSFVRSVPLPKKVKADETRAEYSDGILKVTLPKADEVKPKSVKVEVKK